jgi:hypothetical protein
LSAASAAAARSARVAAALSTSASSPLASSTIAVGASFVHAHTDLTVVGADVVIIDDDSQDLTAQRETIGLEGHASRRLCAPDHGDLAIPEVEAKKQRRAVAPFHERGTHFVDRNTKILDFVNIEARGGSDSTRDEPRHAHETGVRRQHQLDQTVNALIIHPVTSFV